MTDPIRPSADAVRVLGALPMPVGPDPQPTSARLSPRREADAEALHRLADLMDEDDARTGKVGIPVSYGHRLVWLAVVGSHEAWQAEWLRLLRTESLQAANEWSDRQEERIRHLTRLVYPGGATAQSKSAAEVRAMAEGGDGDE
ncbi:hypothetical protein ABZ819_04865 [Streptomyces venezuelae]|uniref:hypothetical protein n=1 Tax=Streptomyces venezuelae TaxID=54571 RepID=UPI00343B82DB